MPITYTLDRVRRRLFAVARGSITYSEIVAHLEKERDDNGLPFAEIIEATQAYVALSAAEVRRVVDLLRDLGRHNALGPTAVITGNDFSYGIMRMLGILVEDVCAVRPFRDRGEAEEWLDAIPMPRPPAQEG
jgi:hypothetical protein